MRTFGLPAVVEVPAEARLTDAVTTNAAQHPASVAFLRPRGADWLPVTCAEFAAEVDRLAAGFLAAGIGTGDRIGLMSRTRYEWTLVDYAAWTIGAVPVPIYETSAPEQVGWILGDSGAVAVVAETDEHVRAIRGLQPDLPDLREVWSMDAGDLDRLAAAGAQVPPQRVAALRAAVRADDAATIIYTSGTTGRPKGCELTHRNLMFEAANCVRALRDIIHEGGSTLLFLPLAHVFARVIQVGCVIARARLGHTADVRHLVADFGTFRPTFILSVPRVFEKIHNSAKTTAVAGGKGRVFALAESTAIAYSQALERGRSGPLLRLRHAVFDRLVYRRIRAAAGGRMAYAVSGGAPLGARLGHFFRGVGITVLEGYGLTETTAGTSLNVPGALRIGTVGRPVPGATLGIADDGEVLVQGQHVFRRYWQNEPATADALDADGWFHTGDLGELDEAGYLTITGRKKEIIVTAAGKNVAPAVLEDRLRSSPLISQCMAVGDQRPFVGLLVTLDPDALPAWKQLHGKPTDATVASLRDDPDLLREIQAAVDDANAVVSRAEGIRKFRVLDVDFTEAGGQLTPKLSLKRSVIAKDFAADIEALYGG